MWNWLINNNKNTNKWEINHFGGWLWIANHHARISRLQKLMISKSQNPKIASTLALTQMRFWTDSFDLKSDKFPPYDILSKAGNLLCFNALTNILKNHWTFTFYRNKKTQKPLYTRRQNRRFLCIRVCLSQSLSVIYFVKN